MPNSATAKTKSALRRPGLVIAAFGLFLIGLLYWTYHSPDGPVLKVGDRTFALEEATTPAQQRQGLSGRMAMGRDQGMLFVFNNEGRPCFWMKDMQFPLDIIWVNTKHKVVHIRKNVSPETYPEAFCPDKPAKYVIELNAGEATKAGIRQGQTLAF